MASSPLDWARRGDGPVPRTVRTARRGVAKAQALASHRSIDEAMTAVVEEVARPTAPAVSPADPGTHPITIAALSTYPLHPRRGGGQLRGWYLTEGLGRLDGVRVEVLSLTTDPALAGTHRLGAGVTEHCIVIGGAQADREARLRLMSLDVSITDVAAGLMWPGIEGLANTARDILARASAAVLIQPYLVDVVETLCPGMALIYDSHNDEVELKSSILPSQIRGARWLAGHVDSLERRASEHSVALTATTTTDLDGLGSRYDVTGRTAIVPNGVDTSEIEFITGDERLGRRQISDPRFGLSGNRPTALFIGSGHLPNIEAGRAIAGLARSVPSVDFLLAGDHSTRLGLTHLPSNVHVLGAVSDDVLELLLTSSALALNPMGSGSGSNLKLFTYLAAGLPVVTTPIGARGVDVEASGIISVPRERFGDGIATALSASAAERAQAGRAYVEQHCDWRVLSDRFAAEVHNALASPTPTRAAIPSGRAASKDTMNTTTSSDTSPESQNAEPQRTVFVEVTNTLAVNYITGFQRHTREMLGRLMTLDGPVRYEPVTWCSECATFRRLTGTELAAFAHFSPRPDAARSRLSTLSDPLPGAAKSLGRRVIRTKAARAAREELARRRRVRNHPAGHADLRIDEWPPDSWLFDLEAAWHNTPHRSDLLPWLHSKGVNSAVLVADVMPFLFHQWFDAGQIRLFTSFFEAHLRYSTKFIAISECSRRDLLKVAGDLNIDNTIDAPVITMGANFTKAAGVTPRPPEAPTGRYILSVATVEPRKNHDLLIRAFDALHDDIDDLCVVFVGKAGWMTDDLQARIRNHRDHGTRLLWLDSVDDTLLGALYQHAYLAVQPAFYEGYGTPVIEALANGVPTLSSNGGSLPEAGGSFAEYFSPDSTEELVALVRQYYLDAELYTERKAALVDYEPPTWELGTAGIAAAFSID